MIEEKVGTISTQPTEEKIKWITRDEAEKYERMLFKNYVRKFPKGADIPAEQDPKEYFYRIISIRPVSPANIVTTSQQFTLLFEVQKYYRNRKRKEKRGEATQIPGQYSTVEVDGNEPVRRWENDEMKNPILVDPDASFPIDTRRFELEFAADNNL